MYRGMEGGLTEGGALVLGAPRRAPRLEGGWRTTLASTFYGFRVLSNPERALVLSFAHSRLGWAWGGLETA